MLQHFWSFTGRTNNNNLEAYVAKAYYEGQCRRFDNSKTNAQIGKIF